MIEGQEASSTSTEASDDPGHSPVATPVARSSYPPPAVDPGAWCVVMPVCDEAATLADVVRRVRTACPFVLLAVDDGSRDGSSELLEALDVPVVRHPNRLGYGRAIASGLSEARTRGFVYAVTIDADGQHAPEEIPALVRAMTGAVDIVSGSRFLAESRVLGRSPPERGATNAAVTRTICADTGWQLSDAFCGMKAYRLHALDGIELVEAGYAGPVELWAKAWRGGLRVREVAVDRIYLDPSRTFRDTALDSADARLALYLSVWKRFTDDEVG